MTSVGFVDLPAESIIHILAQVDYKDLVRCSQVCRRLQELSADDSLWKHQCSTHFFVNESTEGLPWKQRFTDLYKNYGKYISCYSQVRTAWNQVEKYMEEKCPNVMESLQDPVTEEELDEAETKIGYKLPLDLRASLRIHNGQKVRSMGVMGTFIIAQRYGLHYFRTDMLAPLNVMVFKLKEGFIPMTEWDDSRPHMYLYMSLSEECGLDVGTIFNPVEDGSDYRNTEKDYFICAKSFTDWFCTYAQQLEDGVFPLASEFSHFDFPNNVLRFPLKPPCVAETDGISVQVSNVFLPELSTIRPPHFFHAYMITMSMSKDADPNMSCELEERHWTITDGDGKTDSLSGPGVVGEHPVMKPGASFTWFSCNTFETTHGNMKGHFTMRNLKTGLTQTVMCPCFHMKCDPYITAPEVQAQRKKAR